MTEFSLERRKCFHVFVNETNMINAQSIRETLIDTFPGLGFIVEECKYTDKQRVSIDLYDAIHQMKLVRDMVRKWMDDEAKELRLRSNSQCPHWELYLSTCKLVDSFIEDVK